MKRTWEEMRDWVAAYRQGERGVGLSSVAWPEMKKVVVSGVGRRERRLRMSKCLILERGKAVAPRMEQERAWRVGGGVCDYVVFAGKKDDTGAGDV